MKIYLAGLEGPEQLADKWQLQERGYKVVSATDLRQRDLHCNGIEPSPDEFARMQAYEMLCADAVVVNDSMRNGDLMRLVNVCHYMGVRLVDQAELPAQCPHVVRQDEIMNELDLATRSTAPGLRTQLKETAHYLMGCVAQASRWFDKHFGWFFQNGNKVQPRPRPYRAGGVKPTMTA
jgi:hypothetical protein